MKSAIFLSFIATFSAALATPLSARAPIKPTPGRASLYRNATSIPVLDKSICRHKLAEGQNVRYDDSGFEPCTNVPFFQPKDGRGYFDSAYALKITELAANECSVFLYPEINCRGKITYVEDNIGECQEIPQTNSFMVVCD